MHFLTIGHSTKTSEELLNLLEENSVQVLVDVRSWPSSTRNPQFNIEKLKGYLEVHGIQYVWLGKELGGHRHKGLGEQSPNKAWVSEGFRNYADHILTADFKKGIEKLLSYAEEQNVAYMCAEKFYWRCHRRIISDYLMSQGHKITHIIDKDKNVEHKLTTFAQVKAGKLTYPSR